MPSIDCLLCRARLQFLGRILRRQPPQVVALLSVRCKGRPLPWVSLILKDMRHLRSATSLCSHLPDPEISAPWCRLIIDDPGKWSSSVNSIHFSDSAGDTAVVATPGGGMSTLDHICPECSHCFPTERAVGSHRRIMHQIRCEQRFFAPGSGKCLICATQFRSRLRLLAHLCGARRTRCWDVLRASQEHRLAPEVVARLDELDNQARRTARHAGHSHMLAVGAAVRADGRVVGRASA